MPLHQDLLNLQRAAVQQLQQPLLPRYLGWCVVRMWYRDGTQVKASNMTYSRCFKFDQKSQNHLKPSGRFTAITMLWLQTSMGQILSTFPSTLYSHSSPCMWKYATSPLSLVTQKSKHNNKFRYYNVMWYKFATHQMTNHSQQPNGFLTHKSFSPHIKPAAWSHGSSVMRLVWLKLGTSYGIKDLNVFCLDGINCLNWTKTCVNQLSSIVLTRQTISKTFLSVFGLVFLKNHWWLNLSFSKAFRDFQASHP